MKTFVTTCLLWLVTTFTLFGQDSTAGPNGAVQGGWRVWFDYGLLENRSLNNIGRRLSEAGVTAPSTGNYLSNFGFSFISDARRNMSEMRFLFAMGESDSDINTTGRFGQLSGFGFGFFNTFKIVNTRRFIVGPGLGYDLMWYRLSILPPNSGNLSLGSILNNPAANSTIRLRTGFYSNLHGAVSVDYRVYWFRKHYNEFRFGLRAGYQFPFLRNRTWRYDDSTVGDVPRFDANTFYAHFGITVIPKSSTK